MSRPRDSQRSKVYRSENVAFPKAKRGPHEGLETVDECRAYIVKLMGYKWFQRRWPEYTTAPVIRDGRGTRVARGGAYWLNLPRWARTKPVILHELAHSLISSGAAYHRPLGEEQPAHHGWEFCDVYLQLVRLALGKEEHDALRQAFKANRVRYTKPRAKRELGPEERQALVDRLAKARAARQGPRVVESITAAEPPPVNPPSLEIRVSNLAPEAVMIAETGSGAWGLARPTSDTDAAAVIIETPSQCLGLHPPFKVEQRRSAPEGEPSGPDDVDVTVYGLRHFGQLIARCNPSAVTALFSRPVSNHVDLSVFRPHVRSRLIAKTHAGTATGMINSIDDVTWEDDLSSDLSAKAIKTAVHASCVLIQGLAVMQGDEDFMPLDGALLPWMQSLRDGRMPSRVWRPWAEHLLDLIEDEHRWSDLPESPARDHIDLRLTLIHRAWWVRTGTGGWSSE